MEDLIGLIKNFFDKKSRILFITAFGLTILFSLLLFNFRVSEGADDSSYIYGAWKFIKGEIFPQWHGTFYQIFLGIVILIFGKDLIILKLTSLVFIIFFFVWIYRTFKNKVPAYVLFITIFIISINSHILIYSSLTFSEALYMALQIACLYLFSDLLNKIDSESDYFKLWKEWSGFALIMLLLYLTRSVGISMLISVVFYLIVVKKPKAILFTVIPFITFYFIFFLYKSIFWKSSNMGIESQSAVFYLKDPYNPALGNETIFGYLIRFLKNSYQYLYEQFIAISGINIGDPNLYNLFFAIVFVLLLITALIIFMKGNRFFAFIGIYLIAALGITFITVHSFWDQQRLVMIYYPFMLLIIFYALDVIFSKRKSIIIKLIPIIIGLCALILVLVDSFKQIKENVPVMAKNISGNTFYGYSKGWDNYLKLSEWCGNNLNNSDTIGCRNPTMSFIYSKGKEYKGIYSFPSTQVDSFLFSVRKFPKVMIIDMDELQSNKIENSEKTYLRKNIWGLMMSEKRRLGIIEADSSNTRDLLKIANKYDLSYTFDIVNIYNLTSYGNVLTVIPGNLIDVLKKQHINYLLDGKIGTGFIMNNQEVYVNTIKRYIFFINQKYPDLFENIKTEGEAYPATLYKIHWERI